jgi:hypothetical protein
VRAAAVDIAGLENDARRAAAEWEACASDLHAARERLSAARSLVDPNLRRAHDGPPIPPEDYLRARSELPGLDQREADLSLAEIDARGRADTARRALLAALAEEHADDQRALVKAGAATLRRAMAAMEKISARQLAHHARAGSAFAHPIAMAALLGPDGEAARWLAQMEREGLLDSEG